MKLQTDLRELIELLSSHKVEYIVVGGHAVAYHGHPRFTGAIDFFVRATADNAEKLLAALEAFGFGNVGLDVHALTAPERIIQLLIHAAA